jgi:MFS transporter, DHA2 family, multidrug resistance protein
LNATVTTLPTSRPLVATRPPVNKWLVTLSVSFGTLMGTIDASIVNVALTHIRGTVGATVEEITWISTGFAIATILVMPLTAFLGRLFGQKRVYLASLVLFLVGSVLCGLARSLETLVLFRVIQGFGAGALQPTEQAILRQTFPPKEQGMAMALFALAILIGPAVGPTLGGYIVDHYSWEWIFYINVPVGLLGLVMVVTFVHEPEDILEANRKAAPMVRKNMDWAGIALMAMGLASLQYVLEEGNRNDWFESRLIVALTVFSATMLVAFVIRELTAKVPAVDVRLFKDKVFLSGTVVGGVMFAMLLSLTFLLPVFMQELLGFTAMQSGLALMPRTLVMMVLIPIVGRNYNRLQPQLVVTAGVAAFVLSAWMMGHYTLQTSASGVVAALLVQGVGFSFLMVPLNTLALASIPRHKLTDATGLNSLMRQIGGSVGIAVFATLLSRYGVQARASVAAHLTGTDAGVAGRLAALQAGLAQRGMDAVSAQNSAMQVMGGLVARQAMVLAFERIFMLAGLCFLFVLPAVYFLRRPKVASVGPAPELHVEM